MSFFLFPFFLSKAQRGQVSDNCNNRSGSPFPIFYKTESHCKDNKGSFQIFSVKLFASQNWSVANGIQGLCVGYPHLSHHKRLQSTDLFTVRRTRWCPGHVFWFLWSPNLFSGLFSITPQHPPFSVCILFLTIAATFRVN
jgi:hypothetical protein